MMKIPRNLAVKVLIASFIFQTSIAFILQNSIINHCKKKLPSHNFNLYEPTSSVQSSTSATQSHSKRSFKSQENFNSASYQHLSPLHMIKDDKNIDINQSLYDVELESSISNVPMDSSPMCQLKLVFNCDNIDTEELSETILELGPLSVSVEAVTEKDNYLNDETMWGDLQKTKSWSTALLRVNYPSSYDVQGIIDTIKDIYPGQIYGEVIENIGNVDWITEVQKDWKPQVIDDLTIKFPWHVDDHSLTPTLHKLILEGGAAFGTGDHPTTRLCTKWLSRNIKSMLSSYHDMDAFKKTIDVLDFGCGSAILGLAALRYGATRAIGVDIDRDALVSAQNNCILNDLPMELYITSEEENSNVTDEERSILMNSSRGKLSEYEFAAERALHGQTFDLTVANILAPILINLSSILASYTRPGGKIALSGVVIKQAEVVVKEYSKYFDDVKVEQDEGDWVLITGIRR